MPLGSEDMPPPANQQEVCKRHEAEFSPPAEGSRVGIALQALHLLPIHGLRVAPENGTNGWYIWGGEMSEADDFFQPMCVEHISNKCPLAEVFLALPPGWRFLSDGSYVDIWYDAKLIRPT